MDAKKSTQTNAKLLTKADQERVLNMFQSGINMQTIRKELRLSHPAFHATLKADPKFADQFKVCQHDADLIHAVMIKSLLYGDESVQEIYSPLWKDGEIVKDKEGHPILHLTQVIKKHTPPNEKLITLFLKGWFPELYGEKAEVTIENRDYETPDVLKNRITKALQLGGS